MSEKTIDAQLKPLDKNEITFHQTEGALPVQTLKMGDNEISAQQLALIAENMRVTLLELGYEISLNVQQLNSNTSETTH